MRAKQPEPPPWLRAFFNTYTRGLTREDLQRLFTRDLAERLAAARHDSGRVSWSEPAEFGV